MSLNFTSTFLIDDIMCIVINSEWIKKNKKFIIPQPNFYKNLNLKFIIPLEHFIYRTHNFIRKSKP